MRILPLAGRSLGVWKRDVEAPERRRWIRDICVQLLPSGPALLIGGRNVGPVDFVTRGDLGQGDPRPGQQRRRSCEMSLHRHPRPCPRHIRWQAADCANSMSDVHGRGKRWSEVSHAGEWPSPRARALSAAEDGQLSILSG